MLYEDGESSNTSDKAKLEKQSSPITVSIYKRIYAGTLL